MDDRAAKLLELEPADEVGASVAVMHTLRTGDREGLIKAVQAYLGQVPGKSGCAHIETLRKFVSMVMSETRLFADRIDGVEHAADTLEFWWRNAPQLQGLKVTKPTLVDVGQERSDGQVFVAHFVADTQNIYRVEPAPPEGKRYYLVDADKFDAYEPPAESVGWDDPDTTYPDMIADSIEWTMPPPLEVDPFAHRCAACKVPINSGENFHTINGGTDTQQLVCGRCWDDAIAGRAGRLRHG